MSKVLFLDIDGVCNSRMFAAHQFEKGITGMLGIDPNPVRLVRDIIEETGCEVVLSSTWRLNADSREMVRAQVCDFIDVTPSHRYDKKTKHIGRGMEVAAWLADHSEVERYAILDDDSDFMDDQPLFKTTFMHGLTPNITKSVIEYLNA